MEIELAEKTSLLALEIGARLDTHLQLIQAECLPEEFQAYQEKTGRILAELLNEFMQPIYLEHPSLRPTQLGGDYQIEEGLL